MRAMTAVRAEKKGLKDFKKYQEAAAPPTNSDKIEKAIMPARLVVLGLEAVWGEPTGLAKV